MPRSIDARPVQITHHPNQRVDQGLSDLPKMEFNDLFNNIGRAFKVAFGVDVTSATGLAETIKQETGADLTMLARIIDTLFGGFYNGTQSALDPESAWRWVATTFLQPLGLFLDDGSPLNGANLFGLLDIPFVMLRNSNQELLENPTFFGDLAVGNRRRWSHVTDVYRNDADPAGAETVVCNGELTAIRSNRGKVAEGQMIVGEIHVLGNQVTAGSPGVDLVRLQLVSYFKGARVGTPVTVGLTAFTLDPTGAGWVGAPNTALAGRLELDWIVPAGVDEVELRPEVTAGAAAGRVWVDSGSLERGFNWNRVERDLQGMLGILDGIADPDHWEDAYLGLKDLLSLVGIDTSGWVTSNAFDFWRDFNTNTSSIVRVFAHLGSVVAWENAWDGLRGLAEMIGLDTSEWPDDLDPGGIIVAFATLVTAGNALFKDLGNKAKWTVAWNALTAFIDKLLGTGTITWPVLQPGGWFVDALSFVQGMIGETGRDELFPKGAGGVIGQVPSGLRYAAQLDLGGQLPSGNLYYCVTALVGGAETPPSAEVMYFAAGLGTVGMKIKLVWDAFAGATQYRIYRRVRSIAGDVDSRLIGTVVGTTFTDQTARSGGSAASPPLSVDLAAQAAAEAAAEAAAAANNALVTAADSAVPHAPTFGFLQGVVALPTSSANSVPYPGFLELPIFYYYTLTAVTAGGKESVASAEKMVMILPLCPAQVKLTWTASTTPSTTYRVYRRSSKTGATVRVATGVAGTTFTDTASSGTTSAAPSTTAAVAGAAVATATSTASAAQMTADNANDAAVLAITKYNAVPEGNIVVANVDPQITPEDWGVELLPITGSGATVSGYKNFETATAGTGNGASSSNRVNLQLPAGFKAKAVLIFLTWTADASSSLTPNVWPGAGGISFITAASKAIHPRAGTVMTSYQAVLMASNVSISATAPMTLGVGIAMSDTRYSVYTIDAWMVAIDGSFSGVMDVITSDTAITSLNAAADSVAIVHNSVFQTHRFAGDNAFTDLTISAVAPGMTTNHTASNLTRAAIPGTRTSTIVLTKNIDAAETLSIATTPVPDNGSDQPPSVQGCGIGLVLKSLPIPETDTIGSFAEISSVDTGAFTQTVGSFNAFTKLVEVLRYSPDITVDGATASFTVSYIGTYAVDVDLLCNETHDMTLGIAVNGTIVRSRRCSGYSMTISTKVYAKQGAVISLKVKNNASGNITLDTISSMTISLVNRSYL